MLLARGLFSVFQSREYEQLSIPQIILYVFSSPMEEEENKIRGFRGPSWRVLASGEEASGASVILCPTHPIFLSRRLSWYWFCGIAF
jgi:hypothetical protein